MRNYNGFTMVCYNCDTGEYRETNVKPKGYGWGKPHKISFEDLELIENG